MKKIYFTEEERIQARKEKSKGYSKKYNEKNKALLQAKRIAKKEEEAKLLELYNLLVNKGIIKEGEALC